MYIQITPSVKTCWMIIPPKVALSIGKGYDHVLL